MEELDLNNILSADEIDSLFDSESDKETVSNSNEKEEIVEKQKTTENHIDTEDLFDSESVGSEKEDIQGKENTSSNKVGSSSNNPSFYSSIANACIEDGVFQNLDLEKASNIKNAEDFAQAIRDEITAQLDERQRRIEEALNNGIEPTEIQKYEGTINYLNSISEEALSKESEEGELLRKKLIYNDYLNRGYSKERANREVEKSFNAGTDIEDAKESLKSNKEFFIDSYNKLREEAKDYTLKEEEKERKEAESLKKEILDNSTIFGDIQIDKITRQKAFEAISKPVYKDPKTGEVYTAIQKYEKENRVDFLKNISLLYTLTNGFKDIDKLVKNKVKKEVKKGISELEHTINNTSRTVDGNLKFVSGVEDDPDSYIGKGWKLDV